MAVNLVFGLFTQQTINFILQTGPIWTVRPAVPVLDGLPGADDQGFARFISAVRCRLALLLWGHVTGDITQGLPL